MLGFIYATRRTQRLICPMLLGAVISAATGVQAMWVDVDGFLTNDNQAEDLNPNGNIIEFDSTHINFGFLTITGYDAKGTVDIAGGGGSLNIGSSQVLRLTNFVADMPSSATPGLQFRIIFEHLFPGGPIPGGGVSADQINAFSHDGTSEPPFQNGGNAVPLNAGEDTLDAWQGFVDNVPIGNATGIPPFPNAAGLNQPYQVYGHNDCAHCGLVFSPLLRGDLSFTLGGTRNQFILPSSAEVGNAAIAAAVPEPSTFALAAFGLLSLGVIGHPLPVNKTLVLGETVHPLQQPLGNVVPLHQYDRRFGLPCHENSLASFEI